MIQVENNQDTELLLALLPDRIGHGTYLLPSKGGRKQFVDIVHQYKIPIGSSKYLYSLYHFSNAEMCLTSNVKGRTVAGYLDHHFKYWYGEHHPISVCVS